MDSSSVSLLIDKEHKTSSILTLQPGLMNVILASMSDFQKKWINDTGFGSILKFDTKEYPYEISTLILKSYRPDSSVIHINGKIFKIAEEDVEKVLGLPRGRKDISFLEDKKVFEQWKLQFHKQRNSDKILPSTICNAIRMENDVNEDFKLNFIVLMSNILIRGSKTGYVNTEMIQFAGNIDQVFEFNWCKFLLLCLKESWMEWNADQKSSKFRGSIAFLLFFVLDSISRESNDSNSTMPAFTRWKDSDILYVKIDKLSGNISLNNSMNVHTSEEFKVGENNLLANRIIKMVCEDIDRDFKNDEDATPEILLTVLKEALEEFNNLQEKCMQHLTDATISFPGDCSVVSLTSKFISLHEKAYAFVSNKIVQRDIRNYMISSSSNNSYINRNLKFLDNQLENQKNIVWDLVNADGEDPNEVFFKWNNIRSCRVDFQSLNFGEMITTSIIDVWCCLLSKFDYEKPQNQRKRIFCFTQNTIGILDATKKIPFESMYKIFEKNMDIIFDIYGISLGNIDMIFFPMFIFNHYYVVCYNLQAPSLEILDNRKSEKMVHDLYGDQINILHNYFTKYLETKGHEKIMDIKFLIPERLKMIWQTKYNDVDCGIFVMRHMETYVGGGSDSWVTDIVPESYEQMVQLNNMRIHFLFSMLTSDHNEYRGIFYKRGDADKIFKNKDEGV